MSRNYQLQKLWGIARIWRHDTNTSEISYDVNEILLRETFQVEHSNSCDLAFWYHEQI